MFVWLIVKAINSNAMKEYTQLNRPKSFIRVQKMPLKDIVLWIFQNNGIQQC